MRLLEARLEPPEARPAPSRGAPYRSPGLALGALPTGDDAWAIAYLRAGRRGVTEALVAAAVAAGWLGDDEAPIEPPEDARLRALHHAMGKVKRDAGSLREHAAAVAQQLEPAILAALQPYGRTPRMKVLAFALHALPGVAVALVGWVRCVRADLLHRPHGILDVLVVASVLGALVLGARAMNSTSPRARRYQGWVSDAMQSLRRDVQSGERAEPSDVALAVAAYGVASLHVAPVLAAMPIALYAPPASSSCSGGSSCGGGGCGGGCGGGGCGG